MTALGSFFGRLSQRDHQQVALAAAAAAAFTVWALSRPGYDTRPFPKIKRAPEHAKDGPCKYDVYPGGKQLDTPLGRINYYIVGPDSAQKKLLLVHGISTPSPAWQKIMPYLIEAGYQVLTFDLYGRGYSDAPDVAYDAPLFASQIAYLLTALNLPGWDRFDLVGMSLGGPIASTFAHYFPQRIKRVYLLCPAGGTPKTKLSILTRFALSHWNIFGTGAILRFGAINPRKSNDIAKWQVEHHPGFLLAFSRSMTQGPIFNMQELLQKTVETYGERLAAVWGDADDIVPMASKQYWGNLRVDVIPGGNHWIVISLPEEVAKLMVAHLSK